MTAPDLEPGDPGPIRTEAVANDGSALFGWALALLVAVLFGVIFALAAGGSCS